MTPREKHNAYRREYSKTDKARATQKKYTQTPKNIAYRKEYRRKYMEREGMKEYMQNWHSKKRQELRGKVLSSFESKCKKCGFSDVRALQVDHIDGGGNKERRKISEYTYYRKILDSIFNKENKYQLLCANCNWIKKFDNNEKKMGL